MSIGFWVFTIGSGLIFINDQIKQGIPNLLGFIPIFFIGLLVDGLIALITNEIDS